MQVELYSRILNIFQRYFLLDTHIRAVSLFVYLLNSLFSSTDLNIQKILLNKNTRFLTRFEPTAPAGQRETVVRSDVP